MSMQTEHARVEQSGEVTELTYRDAVNAALRDELTSDPTVYFLGEDVGTAGGVFKTNDGLAEAFPGRVLNTPICENGFLGVALGMAVTGLRPVVEIMFSDFLPTGADALVNEIPKFRYMSGGQCEVPLTVRSIGGGTGRFGTQHSATGESWFLHLPGLYVATAGSPGAAYEVLRAAIRNRNPVLFFEHKGLYGRKGPVRRGSVAEFGKAEVLREGGDVTVLSTLLMAQRTLAAAQELAEDGVDVEVIDMRWLRPLDLETVRASVDKTGRLLVVEEQVHAAGWGATVISRLTMEGREWASPPQAIGLSDELLIPYSPPLEDESIPSVAAIAERVRALVGGRAPSN
jgi:acetoin:2,6-dichlorophenolindophenol oxidoreductase subunit beta